MNPSCIGKYIAQKRKEQTFTQEQLAEQLGVSNKTVSKWETGKCMPDYAVIQPLCEALHVTVSELLEGEDQKECSACGCDEAQIMSLLQRVQELEQQKKAFESIAYTVCSIVVSQLAKNFYGSPFADIFSLVLKAISVVVSVFAVVSVGGELRRVLFPKRNTDNIFTKKRNPEA